MVNCFAFVPFLAKYRISIILQVADHVTQTVYNYHTMNTQQKSHNVPIACAVIKIITR